MKKSDLILWGWYAVLVLVICLRVIADETQYLSPDSHYYLNMAENYVKGEGFVSSFPYYEMGDKVFIGFFPIGYPLLIAGIHLLTGLSFFIASKVVMLLSLLVIFLLLRKLFHQWAWVPALYFSSFGMLQVFSHSWSEGPFLALEMFLIFTLFKHWKAPDTVSYRAAFKLFLILIGLFLCRYAGMFFMPVMGVMMIWYWVKDRRQIAIVYGVSIVLYSLFVLVYLTNVYWLTGYFSGIERSWTVVVDVYEGLMMAAAGLVNECFIAKNYFFLKGFYVDSIFYFTLVIQVILLLWIYQKGRYVLGPIFRSDLMGLIWLVGGVFLVFIVSIDQLDYRFLAPATMPIYLGVLGGISVLKEGVLFEKVKIPIVVLFLFSLLMNLPKVYLLTFFT